MNKRGDDTLIENLIPILVVAMFLVGGLLGITRIGSQATISEQTYAKQIALAIDEAEPGTNITIDITKLYQIAEKNKFPYNSMIKIDNKEKNVLVKLIDGKGYKFSFDNNAQILWDYTKDERLFIQVG